MSIIYDKIRKEQHFYFQKMLLCRKDNSSQLNVINPETLEVEKHCGLDGELLSFAFVEIIRHQKSTFINTEILEFENFCEIYDKFYFVEIITHIS